MGDFDDWSDYNFLWTQWKSNKILAQIKPYKEILAKEAKNDKRDGTQSDSLMSTHATDKESNSSVENLITTPKRAKT